MSQSGPPKVHRYHAAHPTATGSVAPVRLPEAAPPARYPLTISADRRRLLDADGRPFLVQGDTAWSLIANLAYDDAIRYLDNRRAKGFNTFAPIGPCVALGLDGRALDVEGWVNTDRRQASNTRELIFPIDHLVAFVSFVMTLLPGDIISTGTPSGIGPIKAGDVVTVKVQGVGELVNPVVAD